MPVDLDDQLTALGAALMRDSAPITLDHLHRVDSAHEASATACPAVPLTMRAGRSTRRAWGIAAALATAAAMVVGLVWIGARDDRSELADGPSVGEIEIGVLALDPTAPVASSWKVTSAVVDDLAMWPVDDSGVTRRYASGSATPEHAPALDVWVIDADASASPRASGDPGVTVQGVQAVWLEAGLSTARQLSFERDGSRFIVRGYRLTDQQVIAAAEHTHLSDAGLGDGALIDPEGLPVGVSELMVGVEKEVWLLPGAAETGDIPAVGWADGDRIVWLRSVLADDAFVSAQRVPASTVTDVTVRGHPAFVATYDRQANLLWMAWTEGERSYVLASNDVESDELVAFAEALTPVTHAEWDEMRVASEPDPSQLASVPVQYFPTIDDTLVRDDGRGSTRASYAQFGAEPVAFPVLAVHRDVVTIAVNPTAPEVLADGWPEVEPIGGRRSYMVGADGDLIDIVIELDDGTSLTLGTATLTVAEMRAVADAVELVDRAAWEARYRPMAPYRAPAPPATTAVPATEPPPTSYLAPAGLIGVQERLVALGFDPGPVDGVLGNQTEQAIWAAEKLYLGTPLEEVTGRPSAELVEALGREGGADPRAPRRSVPGGTHVEIDLPRQVLIVYDRDRPVLVTHISTGELDENGEPAQWCETITIDTDAAGNPLPEPEQTSMCGISKTPGGMFDVDHLLPGTRIGPLGAMWNPIYFNFGLAIHGAVNVPRLPASHGAVRVPIEISEYLPDLIPVGTQISVWDGVKEPEDRSREDELPVFGWPDPTATP